MCPCVDFIFHSSLRFLTLISIIQRRTFLSLGQLLNHFLEVVTMNAHEIGHFRAEKDDSWYMGYPITVGSAVEPSLVLLNHSCDPNINRINVGRATVAVAAKDIEKDEEVRN